MGLTFLQIYLLLFSPMHGTWLTRVILLYFMTLMIFFEQYSNETPQYATCSYSLLLSAF
jgi:hypothetical protein